MHLMRLLWIFLRISVLGELAYRSEFFVHLLYSLLNFVTSALSLVVLFQQVQHIHGWTLSSTLALLGVYLILSALRELVFGPSFNALAGLDGQIWTGRFDFTLLRPVPVQFMVSVRHWSMYALIDLVFGAGVLGIAIHMLHQTVMPWQIVGFLLALVVSMGALYGVLLLFTSLIFWSPGFLFTWLFDSLFQMARYPVDVYPFWVRLLLTWLVPVGIMTTIPVQALTGSISPVLLLIVMVVVILLVLFASVVFHIGLRRYTSASS
ncbi:MAG TPA: ABC-2 family transporter protein [Ktedonobacteraceae bacterium]|jgi:ABC-2 type transport system permease protein